MNPFLKKNLVKTLTFLFYFLFLQSFLQKLQIGLLLFARRWHIMASIVSNHLRPLKKGQKCLASTWIDHLITFANHKKARKFYLKRKNWIMSWNKHFHEFFTKKKEKKKKKEKNTQIHLVLRIKLVLSSVIFFSH